MKSYNDFDFTLSQFNLFAKISNLSKLYIRYFRMKVAISKANQVYLAKRWWADYNHVIAFIFNLCCFDFEILRLKFKSNIRFTF